MKRSAFAIMAALACAALPPVGPGAATEGETLYWDDLVEEGAAWLRENTALDLEAAAGALGTNEDWSVLLNQAAEALASDSYELLARFEPEVRWTLAQLDQVEGAAPYADWLRQRLDFFQEAEVYLRPSPSAPRPAHPPAVSSPPAPVRPAPHDVAIWSDRLAQRRPPARAGALVPELKQIFREEGVPPALVWLAEVESSFNPRARSPAGAAGLYQLMPATARSLGVAIEPEDERLDAATNARAAARYLRLLHRRFGAWDLALAAYNAGPGRVSGTLKRTGGRSFGDIAPSLPSETRMYVPKVIATVQVREQVDLRRPGA
jgi:membrane-bound lytic murein transglycosylase D